MPIPFGPIMLPSASLNTEGNLQLKIPCILQSLSILHITCYVLVLSIDKPVAFPLTWTWWVAGRSCALSLKAGTLGGFLGSGGGPKLSNG